MALVITVFKNPPLNVEDVDGVTELLYPHSKKKPYFFFTIISIMIERLDRF